MTYIVNTSPLATAIPEGGVGVVLCMGQSNTFGTTSFTSQLRQPAPWGEGQLANVWEWDKLKRAGGSTAPLSYLEYTSVDGARTGDRAIHQYRPGGTGWGRSGDFYWWEGGAADDGTLSYSAQMGYRLNQRARRPIYTIRCAEGGTGIFNGAGVRNWNLSAGTSLGFGGNANVIQSLWTLAKDKYWGDGMTYLVDNVLGGDSTKAYLLGVVWFLGATDSSNNVDANASADYEQNTRDLFDLTAGGAYVSNSGVRDTLGNESPSDVPVVIVRTEPYFKPGTESTVHTNKPGLLTVRQAQADIAADLPNAVMVDSDPCEREDAPSTGSVYGSPAASNGEHHTGPGALHLGQRIADAIEGLTPLQDPSY